MHKHELKLVNSVYLYLIYSVFQNLVNSMLFALRLLSDYTLQYSQTHMPPAGFEHAFRKIFIAK